MLVGREARERAEAVGRAIIARATRLMQAAGFCAICRRVDGDHRFGIQLRRAVSRARSAREVVLKIGVRHAERGALDIFSREICRPRPPWRRASLASPAVAPEPQPVIRLFSFGRPRQRRQASRSTARAFDVIDNAPNELAPGASPPGPAAGERELSARCALTPLIALAYGRSGDKGDTANIRVIARRPEFRRDPRRSDAGRSAALHAPFRRGAKSSGSKWPGLEDSIFSCIARSAAAASPRSVTIRRAGHSLRFCSRWKFRRLAAWF